MNMKEKSKVFILGLMVGLIVGGAFFILKLDDYFHKLRIIRHDLSISENKVDFQSEEQRLQKLERGGYKPEKKVYSQEAEFDQKDSTMTEIGDADMSTNSDLMDSLLWNNNDTLINSIGQTDADEEIIIRKDELVLSKKVEVKQVGMDSVGINSIDSLLEKVTGIRDESYSKEILEVEFWNSPLNYKGYKFSGNKLQVYGLNSVVSFQILILDEIMYFKTSNVIYQIEQSSVFSPYVRVTDPYVLEQLK